MDKELIDFAKKYAKDQGTSVSGLIENYFRLLAQNQHSQRSTSIVGSIKGIVQEKELVSKSDYLAYLQKKYQ